MPIKIEPTIKYIKFLSKIEKATINVPNKDERTPKINIFFLPNLPINSETGINNNASVKNCNESGSVAYSCFGDRTNPTKPVFIMPMLVVVTDKPWAIAKTKTFFFAKSNFDLN